MYLKILFGKWHSTLGPKSIVFAPCLKTHLFNIIGVHIVLSLKYHDLCSDFKSLYILFCFLTSINTLILLSRRHLFQIPRHVGVQFINIRDWLNQSTEFYL